MTTATATRTKKTATRKPAKTIEEKKAQAEALHQSISDQVEALRDSARWTAFLTFAQAFHAYSLNNVLLILSQMPEASRVAGFRKWQSLNRQVVKGSKGIRIFGYSTKKVTEEDENGNEVEKKIARFPILSVFDPLSRVSLDSPTRMITYLRRAFSYDRPPTHVEPRRLRRGQPCALRPA